MSLIQTLERQKKVNFCNFKVSLIYRRSSSTARARQKRLHKNIMYQKENRGGNGKKKKKFLALKSNMI